MPITILRPAQIKQGLLALLSTALLGCASSGPISLPCAELSTFYQPPHEDNLYKALVTQINDKNVVSQPIYQLAPGFYRLQVVELIDDPRLTVPVSTRAYKTLELQISDDTRYHLAALLDHDKRDSHQGDYWQPTIWRQASTRCELKQNNNDAS